MFLYVDSVAPVLSFTIQMINNDKCFIMSFLYFSNPEETTQFPQISKKA